jgi:hypothetical protein
MNKMDMLTDLILALVLLVLLMIWGDLNELDKDNFQSTQFSARP